MNTPGIISGLKPSISFIQNQQRNTKEKNNTSFSANNTALPQAPASTLKAYSLGVNKISFGWNQASFDRAEKLDKANKAFKEEKITEEQLAPYRDLKKTELVGASLGGFDLSGADLSDAWLDKAHLGHTDFTGAKLHKASFLRANLAKTNFTDADLKGATFTEAHFRIDTKPSTFKNANLENAYFGRAELYGTEFPGANLKGAVFKKALLQTTDFKGAKVYYNPDKPKESTNFENALYFKIGMKNCTKLQNPKTELPSCYITKNEEGNIKMVPFTYEAAEDVFGMKQHRMDVYEEEDRLKASV